MHAHIIINLNIFLRAVLQWMCWQHRLSVKCTPFLSVMPMQAPNRIVLCRNGPCPLAIYSAIRPAIWPVIRYRRWHANACKATRQGKACILLRWTVKFSDCIGMTNKRECVARFNAWLGTRTDLRILFNLSIKSRSWIPCQISRNCRDSRRRHSDPAKLWRKPGREERGAF
jgi:hypothetical protein